MTELLITNASLMLADGVEAKMSVLCRDGKIARVAPSAELADATTGETVDAAGRFLAPGFIDLHIHGTHRFLIDEGPDRLAGLCRVLPRYGVTSFLPTVCPRPPREDAAFVATLAAVRSEGTQILGFHMEGPFLTLTGALPEEALGSADPERVKALIEAAKPYPAIFSVAPDFEGILGLLPLMAAGGVPVFMTHTRADVKQTQAAIEAGVRHATHFYDVFPAPEETEPGARPVGSVEAVLADPRVSVDFILDGDHVDPVAVRMALACKGPDRVCLITDANVGAGLPPGRYSFAGAEVEFFYPGGPARLTGNSRHAGSLAGSGLTMDRAVRNAVKLVGVEPYQAVRMASANPAQMLGVDAAKGHIREGFDADLILLDEALTVTRTWVGGRSVFDADT